MDSEEREAFTDQELLCPERTARYRLIAVLFVGAALYGGYNVVSFEQAGTSLGWPVYLVVLLAVLGGVSYAVSRSGTSVERDAGVVRAWWSVAGWTQSTETPLAHVEGVALRTVDKFVGGTRYRVYRVVFTGPKLLSPIWMGEAPIQELAAARARALAERLGLPLAQTD